MPLIQFDINNAIRKEVQLNEGLAFVRKKYLDGGLINPEAFEALVETDPTPQKKYVDWIFKQVMKDIARNQPSEITGPNLTNLTNWLKDLFKIFNTGLERNLISKKDIHQYRDFDELDQAVNEIKNKMTAKEQEKDQKWDLADKIYEDKNYLIVSPKSWEGAKFWGAGTRWCITYSSNCTYWNNYFHERRLKFYFIIDKRLDPLEEPWGKIAFGVDDNDYIQESYNAVDNPVDEELVIGKLRSQGVPVDGMFTHEGWEEQAEEDFQNVINKIESDLKDIQDRYELKHAWADYSSDYYSDDVSPDQSFSINLGLNIKVPEEYKLLKPIDQISDSSFEVIKSKINEISNLYVEEMSVADDDIHAYFIIDRRNDVEDDFKDALDEAQHLDDNYESILMTTLRMLSKEKIIKAPELDEYNQIFDEIENSADNDKEFRGMKNLIFGVYPDEAEVYCEIESYERNILVPREFSDKYGRNNWDSENAKKIMKKILIESLLKKGFNPESFYHPNQLLFKDIIGNRDPKYVANIENRKETIKDVLEKSKIYWNFRNHGDSFKRNDFEEVYFTIEFPAPSNLEPVIDMLQTIDDNYDIFINYFVNGLNDAFREKPFKYIKTQTENFGEKFNNLIDKYLSR